MKKYMVSSIKVNGFRGIEKEEIKGFKKLNVIIGRNGTGK